MSNQARFAQIDLSRLPAPDVIEALDYEAIRADILAALGAAVPEIVDVLALESEPLVKLVEIVAYRELILRQRVNDAAKACMLAYATGSTLDHLASLFGVERLEVSPGDPNAVPPIAPTFETDLAFRARVQLSLEGFSTAGPVGAYLFHARSADGGVRDASVISPAPGEVVVTILGPEDVDAPSQAVLDAVTAQLELVRPLGDQLTVQAATLIDFDIQASLTLYPGPDLATVESAAEAQLEIYLDRTERLGHDITRAGIIGALMVEGVQNVSVDAPAADLVIDDVRAARCTGVALGYLGRDV